MSESLDSLIKRIEELESQADFQDGLQESLNLMVAKQDGEILELKRQVSLLAGRLKDFSEAIPGGEPQTEIPPHY